MINLNLLGYKHLHIKILLSFLVFICFFSTLNTMPPLDRDESRFIQATVQMLETKDFVNIKFLDTPRLKKPPGIYWLQALSVTITKNILFLDKAPVWVYRLPSAISAGIAVWLTFLIGQLLFGRAQGLIAALLFVSSPLLMVEAHIAKTDSVLLACILFVTYILAKIIFYKEKKISKPSKFLLYFTWFIFGFAFLIKGPLVILFILSTALFFIKISGVNFLKDTEFIKGICLFLIITLPWFIIIKFGASSDLFIDSVKKDMIYKIISGQESHGAPPGTYFISSILAAWPIFIFILPTALWSFKYKKNKEVLFLLCYTLPAWVFFEIIPTKLLHYILPLLPSLALLTSGMIVSSLKDKNVLNLLDKNILKFISIIPTLGGIVVSIGVIYLGKIYGEGITILISIIAGIYLLSSIFSAYSLFVRNYLNALLTVVFCNIISLNLIIGFLPNQLDKVWVTEKIYKRIEESNINAPFALLGYSEPSIIYRLGSDTKILKNVEEAINFVSKNKINYIIIEHSYLDQFIKLAAENEYLIKNIGESLKGFNYSRGKSVSISIINIS